MSVSRDTAISVAHQAVAQDARGPRSNVSNLRPRTTELYDHTTEERSLTFQDLQWSLIVVALEKLGTFAGQELADEIRARFAHPSARP